MEKSNNEKLIEAVIKGDKISFNKLFDNSKESVIQDKEGNSLIHLASVNGQLELLKVLLESKANIMIKNKNEDIPIHLAASKGNSKIVSCLLDHQIETLEARNKYGETPLLVAVVHGNVDVVHCLIEYNSNIKKRDTKGNNVFHLACSYGHLELVDFFAERNKNLMKVQNSWEDTPFLSAIENNQEKIVKRMLELGYKLNKTDKQKAVHVGAVKGNLQILEMLIGLGLNLELKNRKGDTPLNVACFFGKTDIVRRLIDQGVSTALQPDEYGRNHIHKLCEKGKTEILDCFYTDSHEDLNLQDTFGQTPLHVAIARRHFEITKRFIELGVDLEKKDTSGNTPLLSAITHNQMDIVKLLIEHKADITAINAEKNTIAHLAVTTPNTKLVELIFSYNEDKDPVNIYGYTPLLWILKFQPKLDMIITLIQCQVNIFNIYEGGQSLLQHLLSNHWF
mmetsp:Transcript_10315/g.15086  ORF Transcript_10315/g.15086 Transcript_10315/m.15086 type:complete len:451 (+) Transcript_10315:18-1370(+)